MGFMDYSLISHSVLFSLMLHRYGSVTPRIPVYVSGEISALKKDINNTKIWPVQNKWVIKVEENDSTGLCPVNPNPTRRFYCTLSVSVAPNKDGRPGREI